MSKESNFYIPQLMAITASRALLVPVKASQIEETVFWRELEVGGFEECEFLR